MKAEKIFFALFCTILVTTLLVVTKAMADTNVIKYGGIVSGGFFIDEKGNVSITTDKDVAYPFITSASPVLQGFLVQDAKPTQDFNGQVTVGGKVLTKPTTDQGSHMLLVRSVPIDSQSIVSAQGN